MHPWLKSRALSLAPLARLHRSRDELLVEVERCRAECRSLERSLAPYGAAAGAPKASRIPLPLRQRLAAAALAGTPLGRLYRQQRNLQGELGQLTQKRSELRRALVARRASGATGAAGMPAEEKQALIAGRPWWHSIDLGDGVVTPGKVYHSYLSRLAELMLPARLDGQRVLDIGAWDGFMSFEAERRGAARVVAYDLMPADHFGFALAKRILASQVEYIQGDVYDMKRALFGGGFDLVIFCGVYYHLRHPLLALERIHDVCDGQLLLETQVLDARVVLASGKGLPLAAIDPRLSAIALYQFHRFDELREGDFSNWFVPNEKAVEAALHSSGFAPERIAAWDERVAFRARRLPGPPEFLRLG